jgi:hypothetical protein
MRLTSDGVVLSVCGSGGGWEKFLPLQAPEACFYDVCVPPFLLLFSLLLNVYKEKRPATNTTTSSCLFFGLYLSSITATALLHSALLGLEIIRLFKCPSDGIQCGELSGLLADSQLFLAWVAALFSLVCAPGRMPSSGLRLWWMAAATTASCRAATSLPWSLSWEDWTQDGADFFLIAAAPAVSLVAAVAGLLQRSEPSPTYEPLSDESPPPEGFRSPLAGASWASVLGIGWVWPILKSGLEKPLTPAAFYCLMGPETAVTNRSLTISLWSARVSAWLRRHPEARHRHTGPDEVT